MHIVRLLIVDVHIRAAHVHPVELVLPHIPLPFLHIALEAHGVDFEAPVRSRHQRIVQHLQRLALLLTVVTVRVPEPQYHILRREPVTADPLPRVAALVRVSHPQLLPVRAYQALPYALVVVAHIVQRTLRGPRAAPLQVVLARQVAPHSIPPHILRRTEIARLDEVEHIAQQRRIVANPRRQTVDVSLYRVALGIIQHPEKEIIHLAEQLRTMQQRPRFTFHF